MLNGAGPVAAGRTLIFFSLILNLIKFETDGWIIHNFLCDALVKQMGGGRKCCLEWASECVMQAVAMATIIKGLEIKFARKQLTGELGSTPEPPAQGEAHPLRRWGEGGMGPLPHPSAQWRHQRRVASTRNYQPRGRGVNYTCCWPICRCGATRIETRRRICGKSQREGPAAPAPSIGGAVEWVDEPPVTSAAPDWILRNDRGGRPCGTAEGNFFVINWNCCCYSFFNLEIEYRNFVEVITGDISTTLILEFDDALVKKWRWFDGVTTVAPDVFSDASVSGAVSSWWWEIWTQTRHKYLFLFRIFRIFFAFFRIFEKRTLLKQLWATRWYL